MLQMSSLSRLRRASTYWCYAATRIRKSAVGFSTALLNIWAAEQGSDQHQESWWRLETHTITRRPHMRAAATVRLSNCGHASIHSPYRLQQLSSLLLSPPPEQLPQPSTPLTSLEYSLKQIYGFDRLTPRIKKNSHKQIIGLSHLTPTRRKISIVYSTK